MVIFIPPILFIRLPMMLPIGFIPAMCIMFMGVVEVDGIVARISLLVFMPIPMPPPIFIPKPTFIASWPIF